MMALLFHREIANLTKKALTAGLFLGFLFFVTMAFEILALKQAGVMGALSLLFTCLLERPQLPQTGEHWLILAILTIVCTGFGFTLQPVAQSRVTAQRAGVFCAISPAIAVLLGVAALHERLGLLGWLGLLLILASLLLPYLFRSTSP